MANKDMDKYDVLEKIGQGSFGIIRKVRRRDTGQILCRKEISYTRMSEKEKEQLYAELKILESLKHPNIVQYCHREHIKSCNDLHLYMEYCGNGDLGGYIKKLKDRNQWADEEFVWTIFAQLIGALYRCHYGEDPPEPGNEAIVRKGKTLQTKEGHRMILHRDLKPENVFLSQNNAVKLGDFGLSKIIASHDFASTYVGTPFYMSPEICAAERYSHHSDVWSLGCIIYELASRCVPFDARSHVELVMKIKAGRLKSLPAHYSPELTEVISWCLKVDPRGRPDTAQLLNVTQIKLARARLEQASKLERAQHEFLKMQNERDTALARLQPVQKQVQELQKQVASLQEAEKKIEMEWHTRATLAIDQRVSEEVERLKLDFEKQLAVLRQQDTAKVEKRVQEELRLHYASLPSSHGASQGPDVAVHVRSCTPPPGKHTASFATTATTGVESDGSSIMPDGDALETDMSSLSMMEQELGDDVSPLAQRTKPRKAPRHAFGRAKTFAHGHFTTTDSPMDVHMADPSPMPSHIAPMSNIKGLSLSPRRTGQERLSNCARGKNIFSLAAEQKLRPTVGNEHPSFADDDSDDCENILEDSPSRTSSRLSSISSHGDPFKALGTAKQPLKRARPSLGRQQTMPVSMQQNTTGRAKAPVIPARGIKRSPEKENRPPSSYGRSNVPVINASPKRGAAATKEKKDLTPNRKAPAPPAHGPGLARLAHANNMQSPGRVKGRTLLELQQGRLGPDADAEGSTIMASAPKLLPSPAKWDSMDEDMPSPFLAKKGRTMIR